MKRNPPASTMRRICDTVSLALEPPCCDSCKSGMGLVGNLWVCRKCGNCTGKTRGTRWAALSARLGGRVFHFMDRENKTAYLSRYTLCSIGGYSVYLHKFHRGDEDADPHDHPFPFVSLILSGGYFEEHPYQRFRWYGPGRLLIRRATWRHRISLRRIFRSKDEVTYRGHYDGTDGSEWECRRCGAKWVSRKQQACIRCAAHVPCWTLVVRGPRVREWGFWPWWGTTFVHWKKYLGIESY